MLYSTQGDSTALVIAFSILLKMYFMKVSVQLPSIESEVMECIPETMIIMCHVGAALLEIYCVESCEKEIWNASVGVNE